VLLADLVSLNLLTLKFADPEVCWHRSWLALNPAGTETAIGVRYSSSLTY
jgi:hypothetical protein